MDTSEKLLLLAVCDHNAQEDDEIEGTEATSFAPDVSAQLAVCTGETFSFSGDVSWWLHVRSDKTGQQGYVPSTCVVPLREDLTPQEKHELQNGGEVLSIQVNRKVDLKFFPGVPMDKSQVNRKPCPEETANIFSRLVFFWLSSLVYQGYKRPLQHEDLWALTKKHKSSEVLPKLSRTWAQELTRIHRETETPDAAAAAATGEDARLKTDQDEVEVKFPQKERSLKKVSLLRAMFKVFWPTVLLTFVLKLVHDIIMFSQPYLLERLIAFIEDTSGSTESWHGYMYVLGMFSAAFCQSLILHQYFHAVNIMGMNIRTAVLGLVYSKAIKLNSVSRAQSTAGEMVNLMSVDAQRLMDLVTYVNTLWSSPLQITIALIFLYYTMGLSILAGVGVMLLLIPANYFFSKIIRKLQVKMMASKDVRIKLMNEVLSGIKVLKFYAWEQSFIERISGVRGDELKSLRTGAYLNAAFSFTYTCAPFMVSLATFAIYVLTGNELTAGKAFVALSLFNIMRFPIIMFPNIIASVIQANVSIKRLTAFLCLEELDPENVQRLMPDHISSQAIHVEEGVFSWDKTGKPNLSDINLNIRAGSLVAVVGQVGCGKSTLLSALLGETEKLAGQVYLQGSVAYVPQQAWIQNATLRDNILFKRRFEARRYHRVVHRCALQPDLDMLPGGDLTEIGEKGINLSGGQKQRVSLARAVYFNADVYLFDDPLSAVDAHVGKHIFDKVIGPRGTLRQKTRLLVTHSTGFLPQVDQIIVLQDGRISEVGTYSELLSNQGAFAEFLRTYAAEQHHDHRPEPRRKESIQRPVSYAGGLDAVHGRRADRLEKRARSYSLLTPEPDDGDGDDALDGPRPRRTASTLSVLTSDTADLDGESVLTAKPEDKQVDKMIAEETSETGRVSWAVFWAYMNSLNPLVAVLIVLFSLLADACLVYSRIWLAEWSTATSVTHQQRDTYLGVYGGFGFAQALCVLLASFFLAVGAYGASRHLHRALLVNIMHSPMSFFETTPLGRIVNRFSKDVYVIDDIVPRVFGTFLKTFMNVVSTLAAISFATQYFLIVLVPLGIIYILIQRLYIASSRQLKRIESVSRSPIYNYFFETINGTSTIRAFSQQNRFIQDNFEKVDENQVAYFPTVSSNRWLAVRLEFLGNCIVFFAGLFAVISRNQISSGLVGLAVSYALQVTSTLNWTVRMCSELEANIVAVERVKEYSETPREADWINKDNRPPDAWPQEGTISIEDFDLKYREGLPLVLKNINCQFKPGEKVGIVGRTGAGKSSLTLALFRILERAGGKIVIDGVDISTLGLHDLRSKLTIIPQDPVLFSGSLRHNLDPFQDYSDEQLWRVLEVSHLKNFVSGLDQGLQHQITEGGENISVGQRQLVCLARALLRHSKVLVLDEATAAVDLETDELIQQTIRREFADRTVLTIAHRLNTIMDYNRILVLDKGFVVEFDTPASLLEQKGIFYGMARDAGLVRGDEGPAIQVSQDE